MPDLHSWYLLSYSLRKLGRGSFFSWHGNSISRCSNRPSEIFWLSFRSQIAQEVSLSMCLINNSSHNARVGSSHCCGCHSVSFVGWQAGSTQIMFGCVICPFSGLCSTDCPRRKGFKLSTEQKIFMTFTREKDHHERRSERSSLCEPANFRQRRAAPKQVPHCAPRQLSKLRCTASQVGTFLKCVYLRSKNLKTMSLRPNPIKRL